MAVGYLKTGQNISLTSKSFFDRKQSLCVTDNRGGKVSLWAEGTQRNVIDGHSRFKPAHFTPGREISSLSIRLKSFCYTPEQTLIHVNTAQLCNSNNSIIIYACVTHDVCTNLCTKV